jgi:hypothetical protein
MTSAPPGWSGKKGVTLYTLPEMIIQQFRGVLCCATTAFVNVLFVEVVLPEPGFFAGTGEGVTVVGMFCNAWSEVVDTASVVL